jgi:hypothetical protein
MTDEPASRVSLPLTFPPGNRKLALITLDLFVICILNFCYIQFEWWNIRLNSRIVSTESKLISSLIDEFVWTLFSGIVSWCVVNTIINMFMPSTQTFINIVIFALQVSPLLGHLQVRDSNVKRFYSSKHVVFTKLTNLSLGSECRFYIYIHARYVVPEC